MSLVNSPSIISSGLTYFSDIGNPKSWKGRNTTNYCYAQNARVDSSYASYSATGSGTWNIKHPDALTVYNTDGTDITGYVNTGVGDWTNTYHAIWVYDYELKKPVVSMRDIDGQWKAKSWGLGQTYTSMGLSAGFQYTISWLSWSDDITKCANAGIYSANSSGSWNFWDGQSNSQSTAFNTKPRTWERVYATFTVASGLNYSSGLSCYMYGHYGNRGTVKIADVQIETGLYSGFNSTSSRSNTQVLLDLTGNNTVTASSMTYLGTNEYTFTGGDWFTVSNMAVSGAGARSVFAWVKASSAAQKCILSTGTAANSQAFNLVTYGGNTKIGVMGYNNDFYPSSGANIFTNTWHYVGATYDGTYINTYVDGVLDNTSGAMTMATTGNNNYIGKSNHVGAENYWSGSISVVHAYNRALSAAEVFQNFNALRGRFGV